MHRKPWRAGLAALLLAACASPSAFGAEVLVDWTSNTTGTLPEANVIVSTSGADPISLFTGDFTSSFGRPNIFTGPVSLSETLLLVGEKSSPPTYTVMFTAAVSGVAMHFVSLASKLTFDRSVSLLSGDTLAVSGNVVTGTAGNGDLDSSGTILIGNVASGQAFSFRADSSPLNGEQFAIQMYSGYVAPSSVVPLPAAAWLLGSGLLGLFGLARRRQTTAEA